MSAIQNSFNLLQTVEQLGGAREALTVKNKEVAAQKKSLGFESDDSSDDVDTVCDIQPVAHAKYRKLVNESCELRGKVRDLEKRIKIALKKTPLSPET